MPGYPSSERKLTRERIEGAFAALAERLEERNVRAHIYVVGWTVMVMAHRRDEATLDVDALSIEPPDTVLDVAEQLAGKLDLDPDWLNDRVLKVPVLPGSADERAETLYDSQSLVVTGAGPQYMLAMKVEAGRSSDARDIKLLVRELGLQTLDEVRGIHSQVYPERELPQKKAEFLSKLLLEVAVEWRREQGARGRGDAGHEY